MGRNGRLVVSVSVFVCVYLFLSLSFLLACLYRDLSLLLGLCKCDEWPHTHTQRVTVHAVPETAWAKNGQNEKEVRNVMSVEGVMKHGSSLRNPS